MSANSPVAAPSTQLARSFDRWHPSSWRRPMAEFVVVFGLWVGLLTIGLWRGQLVVQAALVAPLTLVSGQLFAIAHDAGHGSFSSSRTLNGVVGRLGFVPSFHVFGLWRFHHDVHHRYTNLRSRDFVWTPLSVAEYRALPRHRRWLHRAVRHRSGLGLGLHYALEIWAPRMLWPRRSQVTQQRSLLLADTFAFYCLLAALAVSAWRFVTIVDAERAGDVGAWASAIVLLVAFPLIGTQWLIGFVIYLNHTHPDIVWYDDADLWSRQEVQLEGAAGVRFDPRRHLALPRRIMNHTVHHVDPGVPLRSLATAQRRLVADRPGQVVSWDWSRRRFGEVLNRCKLYDLDAQQWVPYPAREDVR